MDNILPRILLQTRQHVATCQQQLPLSLMMQQAEQAPPARPFAAAIKQHKEQGTPALIAEIKKASPSAGVLLPDYRPADLARAYEKAGAACLSVLTDTPFFQGSLEDMRRARAACGLPVLRKDFMLTPYQVAEARAAGSDCILLIMACLDGKTAQSLYALARRLGMDVLAEAHTAVELEQALLMDDALIGINNRNLDSLQTDIALTEQLAPQMPEGRMLVSESGIKTASDIRRLQRCGASAFLVGHSLLQQQDVEAATRALLGEPS